MALAFTFVVTADGQEKARRRHTWCPQAGRHAGGPGAGGLGAFINDSYWLLAPSKVMDAAVVRGLDAEGRLALVFADGGLTPGDLYL